MLESPHYAGATRPPTPPRALRALRPTHRPARDGRGRAADPPGPSVALRRGDPQAEPRGAVRRPVGRLRSPRPLPRRRTLRPGLPDSRAHPPAPPPLADRPGVARGPASPGGAPARAAPRQLHDRLPARPR